LIVGESQFLPFLSHESFYQILSMPAHTVTRRDSTAQTAKPCRCLPPEKKSSKEL
jgi:hypothetical protein